MTATPQIDWKLSPCGRWHTGLLPGGNLYVAARSEPPMFALAAESEEAVNAKAQRALDFEADQWTRT